MPRPPKRSAPLRRGALRRQWDRWVHAVGLQSVLFALLTGVCALVLLAVTWFLFPESCALLR